MGDENEGISDGMWRARKRFFFPPDEAEFFGPLKAIASRLSPATTMESEAFARNLLGAMRTAAVPFLLVHESVSRRNWQRIHSAERIRALTVFDDTPEDQAASDALALSKARQRLREEQDTPEARDRGVRAVLGELSDHLDDPGFASVADELLRQTASLTWTSCELLIVSLYEHAAQRQCDIGVKKALAYLLPHTGTGREILERFGLWLLFQRRHLFVHRRGIVDPDYLRDTNDSIPLGGELTVSPDDLESYFEYARDFAIHLLTTVDNRG